MSGDGKTVTAGMPTTVEDNSNAQKEKVDYSEGKFKSSVLN